MLECWNFYLQLNNTTLLVFAFNPVRILFSGIASEKIRGAGSDIDGIGGGRDLVLINS